jgi:WD40 repeat protein
MAVVGPGQIVRVIALEDQRELKRFNHRYRITGLAFTRDDERLTTVTANETVHDWDVKTGTLVAEFWLKGEDRSVIVNSRGVWILSTRDGDPMVRVWDATHSLELNRIMLNERERTIALSPDARWLASRSDGFVSLRNLRSPDAPLRLRINPPPKKYIPPFQVELFLFEDKTIMAGCFSADSSTFSGITAAGVVRSWDVVTGKELAVFAAQYRYSPIPAIACNPEGNSIATAIPDGVVRIWSGTHGHEIARFRRGAFDAK